MTGETLGAKFSIDITDLKTGISQANRLIKESRSEFKAAAAGMDDWTKSEEGLTAKLKSLNDISEIQATKIDALQKEYDRCITNGVDPMSASMIKMRTDLNEEQAALEKTKSEIKKYEDSLSNVKTASENYSTASEKLQNTIKEQKKEIANLSDEYQSIVLEQGKNSEAAKELENEINDLNKKLTENKTKLNESKIELKDTGEAAEDAADSIENAGESAEKSGDGFTVMKGALADLISEGIKKTIDSLKDLLITSDKVFSKFQAETGISSEYMQEMQEAMTSVYADNFGQSLEDVAGAMANIKQQTGIINGNFLKNMTENALLLRDTFDFEVNESIRAADMLMDQFGLDGDEAYNLIAQGAQQGLNKNGDLLDVINEYSVHFENQGYSAEEFFNMLKNGSKEGTFSVDKLGDAMKEFGIRTKDNSDATKQAFSDLGLDADKLTKKFAEGGEASRSASDEVIMALFEMDDAVKRNEIGTALFGTMWEDLGEDGVRALSGLTGGAISLKEDALDQINEVRYDNLSDALEGVKRKIEGDLMPTINNLTPVISDALDTFVADYLPKIESGFQWIIDNKDVIVSGLEAIAAGFLAFKVVTIIQSVTTALEGMTIAQAALNVVMNANPIGLVVAAIAALAAGFIALWNNCDGFRNFFLDMGEKIKEAWQTAVQFIKDKIEEWKQKFDDLKTKISETKDNVVQKFEDIKTGITEKIESAKKAVVQKFEDIKTSLSEKVQAIKDDIKDKFDAAKDAITQPIEDAKEKVKEIVDKLKGMFDFEWKLPHIKLPHLSMTPGEAPYGIGGKGHLPTFDIQWLKNGGIVTQATNAIIGEDGPEAVIPLKNNTEFLDYLAEKLNEKQAQQIVVNQTNNYSQAHSRYELYKSKQQTAAAVRLAMQGG